MILPASITQKNSTVNSSFFFFFCLFSYDFLPVECYIGSVMTPYYSEETVYSKSDLELENEDGISIIFYLQKIYPGIKLYILTYRDTYFITFYCFMSHNS